VRFGDSATQQALLLTGCLVVTACAGRTPQNTAIGFDDERAILSLVQSALNMDAGGVKLDSLYTTSAIIVANGAERTAAPLFAGIGTGGTVRISSLTGNASPPFGWAYAAYRWTSSDASITESAMATFVLTRADGRWRIRHAHSSLVLPWQRSSEAD
jgi:SnoaL-like domain